MNQSGFGRDMLDPLATTMFPLPPPRTSGAEAGGTSAFPPDPPHGPAAENANSYSLYAPQHGTSATAAPALEGAAGRRNRGWWIAGSLAIVTVVVAFVGLLMQYSARAEIDRLNSTVETQQTQLATADQEQARLVQANSDAEASAKACSDATGRLNEWWTDLDAEGDSYKLSMEVIRLCMTK